MRELIYDVEEEEMEGGYVATALGYGIVTQAETLEELRAMVKDATQCHFGDSGPGLMPKTIRLRFIREEVLTP